jgi:hypothetical protein
MAIKRTTTTEQINKHIAAHMQAKEKKIVKTLCYVGTQCVNIARMHGTYRDQTGNLRSSTGYVVAVNGIIVDESNFELVNGATEGRTTGKEYLRQILSENGSGIVLIVVAGMNYAKHVASRGYDVLDNAERTAEILVPYMVSKILK